MKIVLQDGMKDCGVCCLLSIIRFYGGEVSKEYLRELTNTTKEGVSLYQLLYAAKLLGFEASGEAGNLEDIKVNNLPCIVHFQLHKNYQHFVVLYKINFQKKLVSIMDPAKGNQNYSFAEFHLLSSNHYLFLKPIKRLPILKKKNIVLKNIQKLIIHHKKNIFSIIFFTVQYFLFTLLSSFHFKYLIDYSIQYQITKNLISFCIIIGCFYFFKNCSNLIRTLLLTKWNSFFHLELSSAIYKQILLLPYYYYKNRTTGEVLTRFKDLNIVVEYISNLFSTLITDFFSCILFMILLGSYHLQLFLTLNGILFLYMIFLLLPYKTKKRHYKNYKSQEELTNSYIIQAISNVDTVKGCHLEKRFIDKFFHHFQKYQDSIYKMIRFLGFENTIKDGFMDTLMIVLYGFGTIFVIQEKMTFSTLILFQTFFHYYLNSFLRILHIIQEYPNYIVSLNRIEELFLLDSENFKNNYYYLSYTLNGPIVIQDLSYQIGTKVLFQHLSLQILLGEKILLCGESGSGKSTLVKMLLRYIEVEYGKISIDGIDINHYHLENIRSHITYVTANEYLFHDSIRNNVMLYQDYKEEEFLEVCKICCVDEIVSSSEKGYDRMIEEDGFNISNGERQRIVLARSILKKSSIYIFDEAFSQIDIERERTILKNIFEFFPNRTIIVISHRFHNKKYFERVLRFRGGKLYEESRI